MRRVFALLALLSGSALAHTEVTRITPALHAQVKAPREVKLELSEAINLRFSQFWVYAVPTGQSAAAFAETVLPTKGCDSAQADTCPRLTGLASRLTLPLKVGLKAGEYVVIWHILSDDGHPVKGQSSFIVK